MEVKYELYREIASRLSEEFRTDPVYHFLTKRQLHVTINSPVYKTATAAFVIEIIDGMLVWKVNKNNIPDLPIVEENLVDPDAIDRLLKKVITWTRTTIS